MAFETFKASLIELGVSESLPYVSGVLRYEGLPARLRFAMLDRLDFKILASGKSNADGTYKRYLPNDYVTDKQLMVVSFDDTGVYNAQVADLINAVT